MITASAGFLVSIVLGILGLPQSDALAFRLTPYIVIPLISVAVNIYLLRTLAHRRRSIKGAMWISIFILSALVWSLTDLATYSAANAYTGLIVRSGIALSALIGLPALLVFVVYNTYDEAEEFMGGFVSILGTSFVVIAMALATNFIFIRKPSALIPHFWGYEMTLGPLGTIYLAWFQFLTLLIAGLLVRNYYRERHSKKKRQARIFLISVLVPIIGTTLTNILPAYLNLPFLLPLESLFTTVMGALMCYGILRCSLFSINPAEVATNILDTMAETVIVTDTRFGLEYANASAEKLFGINNEAVRGNKVDSYFAAEDFSRIRHLLVVDPNIKEPQRLDGLSVITQQTHKITPVDLALSAILDERGQLAGYVFVMTDISKLKQAYAQLANEERVVEQKVMERNEELYTEHAKLEASIASLPIGFIMLDETMRVLEFNSVAHKLLGIKAQTKKAVTEALSNLGVEQDFARVHSECATADIPEIKLGKDTLHLIIAPIIGGRSDCIGCVILIEDISKQKAAERERNDFIVTASHEMRTPLTIVQGNLSNALDPDIAKLSKEAKPLVEQAYSSALQLSELFKDILTVSEIDNGEAPHYEHKTGFRLTEVTRDVVKKYRHMADTKKIALIYSDPQSDIEVAGDPNETKEVLSKLVENAIKYSRKGHVAVELTRSGSWAIVSIEDSGLGIPSADRDKLFKKFSRVDNNLTREVGGTGLGLYIAQSLAERNGGEVTLEHSGPKGSIFSLKLPLQK
jgi:PAS domain S-box-containing protein